jgi:hypothetical protein
MSEGLKIRAQIDSDNVRSLLAISGGASIALLAFLPFVLSKPEYRALAFAIVFGLLFYQASLVLAVIHSIYRRACSLIYEQNKFRPLPGKFLGRQLKEPRVCYIGKLYLKWSLAAFITASLIVFAGGVASLMPDTASAECTKIYTCNKKDVTL